MYKLTKRREAKALPILERAYESLVTRGGFDVRILERDLRACWNIGYHELYSVLEDAFKDERQSFKILGALMSARKARRCLAFQTTIGRADRLGSGVRNLYKYCKDYGGADPVFTEGNNFVISVSLKKLDPIRFPFEKPSIGDEKQPIGDEKPSIGDEKQPIGDDKPSFDPEKTSVEFLAQKYNLTRPTSENIRKLLCAFGANVVFGRSMVMAETGLEISAAGVLINVMLRHRLLDTVRGHGKGKYRFRTTVLTGEEF